MGEYEDEYKRAHMRPDTDFSPQSIHHTLGEAGNMAARGDHGHKNYEQELADADSRLDALEAGGGGGTVATAQARLAKVTNQLLNNNTTTIVTFDSVTYSDPPTFADVANNRLVIPQDGTYAIVGYIQGGPGSTGTVGYRSAQVLIDGVGYRFNRIWPQQNINWSVLAPLVIKLTAGQVITMNAIQTSGSNDVPLVGAAGSALCSLEASLVEGAQGIQGPVGPSTNIDVEYNDVIAATAVHTLNFKGAGVTSLFEFIDGTARIVIPGVTGPAGGDLTGSYPDPLIGGGKVLAGNIAADAVTNAKIADNAVGNAELQDNAVGTVEIQDNAVTLAKMADASVGTLELVNLSVTDAKVAAANKDGADATPSMRTLGTGGAQAAKGNHGHTPISIFPNLSDIDQSVIAYTTAGGYHNSKVLTALINDNAITLAKMADASVGTAELVDSGVTNAKLAADAVTPDKIANLPSVPANASDPTSKTYVDNQINAVAVIAVDAKPDIYDEGALVLADTSKVNFTGAGVTAVVGGTGEVVVNIPGGGGGGSVWAAGDLKETAAPYTGGGVLHGGEWLLCDGTLVSKTTYAVLFAAIGHTFNAGVDPGSGNFKLPDVRDRNPLGASGARPVGLLSGSDSLSISHLPAHTHGIRMRDAAGSQQANVAGGGGASTVVNNTAGDPTGSGAQFKSPYFAVNFLIHI